MVRVSDLVQYILCPRILYYRRRGMDYRPRRHREQEVWRELALARVPAERIRGEAEALVARLVPRVPVVGQRHPPEGVAFRSNDEPGDSRRSREVPPEERGPLLEQVLQGIPPGGYGDLPGGDRLDVALESKALGLSGRIDRVLEREGEEVPVLLRAGRPPSSGAYRSDRMALAAYAMLLQEQSGRPVRRGRVEYLPSATPREVRLTERDRQMARYVLRKVEKAGDRFPRRPWRAPCETCNFLPHCYPRRRPPEWLSGEGGAESPGG